MNWKPIDTLPKDGTVVLVKEGNGHIYPGFYKDLGGGWDLLFLDDSGRFVDKNMAETDCAIELNAIQLNGKHHFTEWANLDGN